MSLQHNVRARLGSTYRRWRKRADHPDIRQARLLVRRLRSGPLDVLHLGASESLFISPDDADKRTLPEMIAHGLGPDVSMYSIAVPSQTPRLYKAYLDIVSSYPNRPIVAMHLPLRIGWTAWEQHPEHGHQRSLKALTRIPPGRPPWRFHASVPFIPAEEYARHDLVKIPTLDGTSTYGEFRRQVLDPAGTGLDREQHIRQSFNFLHGNTEPLNQTYLDSVTEVGARLRELGISAVVFHTPVPLDRITEVLGPEVRERTVQNFAALDASFIAGYGPIDIVQTFASLDTNTFLDPDDGIEHFNERGRKYIAEVVVDAIHKLRARQ